MQDMVPLYGFGGVPYSAVRKAAPRNLLDNSDFRNPANQRGFTSTTSTLDGMGIDRWEFSVNSSGSIRLTNDGLVCDKGNLIQKFEPGVLSSEKQYYPALFLNDGSTVKFNWIEFDCYGDGSRISRVVYFNVSGTVVAAAMYEGTYTAETLPEYQPKGYGAELAECMRYYQIRSVNNIAAVDMRPTMRLNNPTITSVTGGYAYSADL